MSKDRTSDGGPKRSDTRWLKWLGLTVLLLVLAAVAGHWGWGRMRERRLDALIARYRAAGEPMLPSDLVAPTVPYDQNAVIDLRAAAAMIDTKSEAWDAFDRLEPALPLTDREIAILKQVLDERQDALAKARDATLKPGVDWQMQFPSPMLTNLDLRDLTQQRALARLLAAAALYAHHAGDDAEAIRRIREVLFISRAVGQQPTLVSGLTSVGIASVAIARVQQIAPDLRVDDRRSATEPAATPASPEQLRTLMIELADAGGAAQDMRRALRGERVSELDAIRALVDGRFALDSSQNNSKEAGERTGYVMKPLFLGDALLMAEYVSGMLGALDAPNLPAARGRWPTTFAKEVEQHPKRHLVAAILLPALGRTHEINYRRLTEGRLAAVALAARWYTIGHDGALPRRLEDLVPDYLPAVPLDPMAAGGTLHFLPGADPVVYSVGMNATDEGGSEKSSIKHRPPQEWEMEDRVLHLKRQPRPAPEADEAIEPEGVPPDARVPATTPSSRAALPPRYGG